jgi:O-antigen/teichoic acid export membrane protein
LSGRPLAVKTMLLASSRLLTALSAVVLTGILTRTLSKEAYATHRQVLLVFSMFVPVLTLGLPRASYFFLAGERGRPRGIISENLVALTVLAGVFGLGILLGVGELVTARFDNPEVARLLPWLVPYALLMYPRMAFGSVMVVRSKVLWMMGADVSARLLLMLGMLGAALWWGTAEATVITNTVWAVGYGSVAVWLMFKATPRGTAEGPLVTWPGIRSQIAFAVPLGLATLISGLSAQLDKYIVSSMCSPEAFAIYVTGAIQVPFVAVITGSINSVILPEYAKHYKAGEPHKIVDLWQRAMNTSLLFLAPILGGILLFGPEITTVLFGADYMLSWVPFAIYALILPMRAATYGSVLMATDNARWVTVSAIVGLTLNGGLSVVFVWGLGPEGAAWATTLSTYGVAAFMLWPISKAVHTPVRALMDWRHIGQVLGVATVPGLLLWPALSWLPGPALLRLVLGGAIYGGAVVGLYALTGLAKPRELVALLRKRKRPE